MVEVPLARTSPAALRRRPSAKQVDLPARSIQASAMTSPGRAGAKKLTFSSRDMGVMSPPPAMAAWAIAASIQPQMKPPCTTPPE